jgi:hypothetical protein
MPDFIGYTSLHCDYKHFGYTFADVFLLTVCLYNFLLRNSQIALRIFRLQLRRLRC